MKGQCCVAAEPEGRLQSFSNHCQNPEDCRTGADARPFITSLVMYSVGLRFCIRRRRIGGEVHPDGVGVRPHLVLRLHGDYGDRRDHAEKKNNGEYGWLARAHEI